MGRNRIHDENHTYFEKYGSRQGVYDSRRKINPNFLYDIYIAQEHYRSMAPQRMKELIKQMMPGLSDYKQRKAKEILKSLGR